MRCHKSSSRDAIPSLLHLFQAQESCFFTPEAKTTGVLPEATKMIAEGWELPGRAVENGMSLSNERFAAFVQIFLFLTKEKSANKILSILSLPTSFASFPPPPFFFLALVNTQIEI